MRPKIAVVGSSNTDMVIRLPSLPAPGETVLGDHFEIFPGGKGANQAVAAARLGASVTFIARLGRDHFGEQAARHYRDEGLRLDNLLWDEEAASGVALILVDRHGENQIAVSPGANSRLTPEDIRAAEQAIAAADCLLLQLEIPLESVETAARIAHRNGTKVILNPAPAQALDADLINLVDVLTPNESEAAILCGMQVGDSAQAREAAKRLSRTHACTVVLTLGAQGALLAQNGSVQEIPGHRVAVADSTAAGDAFNGALAVALARRQPLDQAVRFANAAGALAVTKAGAQPSLPMQAEVAALLSSV